MSRKLLIFATLLLSMIGIGLAQTDSSKQLIATPPVPSSEEQQFQQDVKNVHFDFNQALLTDEDKTILSSDADWLKSHPSVLVTLEGDADERGDIIYNVVLSGERATATKDALVELGVPADRIVFATGWGKLYPVCSQSDESCWSQNRRTHFATWPPPEQPAQVASR